MIEVGDVVRIVSIPQVKIRHPLHALYRRQSGPQMVVLTGSYSAIGDNWVPLGFEFNLDPNSETGEYVCVPPEEWTDDICSAMARRALLNSID